MNVSRITPETKDIERARGLIKSGKRTNLNGSPVTTAARKMANAITDRAKLIRRAKAVAAVWGIVDYEGERDGRRVTENIWKPFARRLEELGYGYSDITEISQYEHDSVVEVLGLEGLFD